MLKLVTIPVTLTLCSFTIFVTPALCLLTIYITCISIANITNYKTARNTPIIKFANPSTCIRYIVLDKLLSLLSYLTKISTITKSLSTNKIINLTKTTTNVSRLAKNPSVL